MATSSALAALSLDIVLVLLRAHLKLLRSVSKVLWKACDRHITMVGLPWLPKLRSTLPLLPQLVQRAQYLQRLDMCNLDTATDIDANLFGTLL
jgi:hypothetical protein